MRRDTTLWYFALLLLITVLPLLVILLTAQHFTGATGWQLVAAASPMIVLWLRFLYNHLSRVRETWVKLKAYLLDGQVSMSMTVKYAATSVVGYANIEHMIRSHYVHASPPVRTDTLESTGEMLARMPGWQAIFRVEQPRDDDYDVERAHIQEYVYLDVPDTDRGMRITLRELRDNISHVVGKLANDLPLSIEEIEVNVRFVSDMNPYLSAYLQHVAVERVKHFECWIAEPSDTWVEVRKSSITIRTRNLQALATAVNKHLGL